MYKCSQPGLVENGNAPVIVVARSARLIAESLQRAGIKPIVLDLFGDVDTQLHATHCCLLQNLSADHIIATIDSLNLKKKPYIIYGSGVDNNSDLLEQLGFQFYLLGNNVDSVRWVRNPELFFGLLDDLGITHPAVRFDRPLAVNWLLKRNNHEGGTGITFVQCPETSFLDDQCYYQKQLDGEAFSVLFLANDNSCRIIGLNSQWVVDDNRQYPYLFRGVINRFELTRKHFLRISRWIENIVSVTGLKGLNSLDCLLVDNEIMVLELNPRPSASVSLYDSDYQYGLVKQQIASFTGKSWDKPIEQQQVNGCWVCYAPCDLMIYEQIDWPTWVVDQPLAGTVFSQGEPVCTLIATETSLTEVKQTLRQRCDIITRNITRSTFNQIASLSKLDNDNDSGEKHEQHCQC